MSVITSRLRVDLRATYGWRHTDPEPCTVRVIDLSPPWSGATPQAFVEWDPHLVREGDRYFPVPLPVGTLVARPAGWVDLDRLVFAGLDVVQVIAEAQRAAQDERRSR